MSDLPPSLKRKGARLLAQREAAVLDNYALLRDLRDGAFAGPGQTPTMVHYEVGATELGLIIEARDADDTVFVVSRGDGIPRIIITYNDLGELTFGVTDE